MAFSERLVEHDATGGGAGHAWARLFSKERPRFELAPQQGRAIIAACGIWVGLATPPALGGLDERDRRALLGPIVSALGPGHPLRS